MKKFYLLFFTLLFSFGGYSQVYKCGVTASNYLKLTTKDVRSMCSDKLNNIYHLQGNTIYKNNVAWVQYKPGTYTSIFSYPFYITTDQTNLYVYDNNYILYKVTPDGTVTVLSGKKNISGKTNGLLADATFDGSVVSISADVSGNVYVAHPYFIRKVGIDGYVTILTGQQTSGTANGNAATAQFDYIRSITCDNSGNLYVADAGGDGVYVRKVNASGDVSNFAGGYSRPYTDDTNYKAGFDVLYCVYYGADNYLYVGDRSKIRRISPTGETITLLGGPVSATNSFDLVYGNGNKDVVNAPQSITRTSNGDIYFVSTYSYYEYSIIRKISIDESCESEKRIVETVCGDGYMNANLSGNGKTAEFTYVTSTAMDKLGNVYITAANNKKVFKMTPAKDVSLFYTSGSNSSANAEGLAIDANGNVYVSFGARIEVANSSGTYVKTFVGQYLDPFSAKRMVFDSNGDLIFSDPQYDNIRKLNVSTGVYSTIAGGTNSVINQFNEGYIDGPALTARFTDPVGIDIDSKGNIFIADRYNYCVRKLDTQGNVTTVAGTGGTSGNVNGTGTSALFGALTALTIDNADNMYISDITTNEIKKISAENYDVTTIIGGNNYAYRSHYIDGKASIASFSEPCDMFFDSSNDLWVADQSNSVIRKITGLNASVTTAVIDPSYTKTQNSQTQISYPNPTVNLLHFDKERSYEIYNNNSKLLLSGKNDFVDMSSLPAGFYLIRFSDLNKTEKIIKN